MSKIIFILVFVSLISCKGNDSLVEVTFNNKEVSSLGGIDKIDKTLSDPINIVDLKNSKWLTTTSGVLSASESIVLCTENDSIGFYGFYFLIDKTVGIPMGKLKIHTTDNGGDWRFDSKEEQFAEIKLTSNKIAVWDSIRVGLSEKKLMSFIGERSHYKEGTTLFAELDSYEGVFTIVADTIKELTVKNNCKK